MIRRASTVRNHKQVARRWSVERHGFTLVETLIVVVVIALLASVVMPAMQSTGSQPVEAAARSLAADLRLARGLAMQYNTNYTVRFDLANQAYAIIHTGAGTPPPLHNPLAPGGIQDGTYRVSLNPNAFSTFGQSRIRLRGVQLASTAASVVDVTFGPLGGTGPQRSEDTWIWLASSSSDNSTQYRIRVSWVTGQVWSNAVETDDAPTPSNPPDRSPSVVPSPDAASPSPADSDPYYAIPTSDETARPTTTAPIGSDPYYYAPTSDETAPPSTTDVTPASPITPGPDYYNSRTK